MRRGVTFFFKAKHISALYFHHSGVVCCDNFVGVLLPLVDDDFIANDAVFDFAILIDGDSVAQERALHVADGLDRDVVHYHTVGETNLWLDHTVAANSTVLDGRLLRYHRVFPHETLGPQLKNYNNNF